MAKGRHEKEDLRLDSILILRFSSIGDIVLTTPLIRAVRRRFPQARIDMVTKCEFVELLQTNPHLTHVYAYDARRGWSGLTELASQFRQQRYDLWIDLHKNVRAYLLRALCRPAQVASYSKDIFIRTILVKTHRNWYPSIVPMPERYFGGVQRLGVTPDNAGVELFPTEEHVSRVHRLFVEAGVTAQDTIIGFSPSAAHPLKQWPLERFAALGSQLASRYAARIAIFGGRRDLPTAQMLAAQLPHAPIILCGQLSLLESAAAIRRCAVFICNDSGTMHLAAATPTQIVAFFGPTVAEFGFYPYRAQAQVLCAALPCRPCTHTGKGRCRIAETHACMQRISVSDAYHAVDVLLQDRHAVCC